MKTNKIVWTIAGLALLAATTPQEARMAAAAIIGSDYWSELWPYVVVYLGALAGYFAGPDIAFSLRSLAGDKGNEITKAADLWSRVRQLAARAGRLTDDSTPPSSSQKPIQRALC